MPNVRVSGVSVPGDSTFAFRFVHRRRLPRCKSGFTLRECDISRSMSRPRDSWLQIGLHCAGLLCGAVVSLWLLWLLDDWIPAVIAAVGTLCISLLLYGRHLYLYETRTERETSETLQAHKLAGKLFIEHVREQHATEMEGMRLQLEEARHLAITAETRARAAKTPPRDARGKFVKRRPAVLTLEHDPAP